MLQFSGHYMKVNDKAIYWLDKNKSQKPKGRSQLYNARDRFIDSIMPQYYFSIEFIAKKIVKIRQQKIRNTLYPAGAGFKVYFKSRRN